MELIAVLFIISLMVAFVMPEFSRNILRDDAEITLNWLVFNVSKYKNQARQQGKDLFMCLETHTNLIQIKQAGSDPESTEMDIVAEFSVPEDVSLGRVEFNRPDREGDNPCILFSRKGFSDHAIIHMRDAEGNDFSCLIQPFLPKATIYREYVEF